MPNDTINGASIYYRDMGKGTAVIFIHPPVLTSLTFKHQYRGLSGQFRLIGLDIRGHGKSLPSGQAVTYPLIVEDIKALMDLLNIEKAFICGYSTGGSVVLEFLLTYPDKALGGIVIGGMSEVNDLKLKNKISIGIVLAKAGCVGTIALANAWSNSQSLSYFRELFLDGKNGNANNAEQYYQYSLQYNCTALLEKIPHRVLLVYGEKDPLFHPYAKLLHERLPNNQLVYVKQTDHRIPAKAAEQLNGLITTFIRENLQL